MPCNNRKDLKNAAAITKLRIFPNFAVPTCLSEDYTTDLRHSRFVTVYLWENREDMIAASMNPPGTRAACDHMPYRESPDGSVWISPKVGELHFVEGDWNLEIVAHEILHAIFGIIRAIGPHPEAIFNQDKRSANGSEYLMGSAEEDICYLHGQMVDDVYRWLWENNPSKKWTKKEDK
jgi:hypothetical protein